MQISRKNTFATIKTEGGLLPADLLAHIAEGGANIDGLTPEAYHLARSERLNEAANRAWNRLQGAWEGFSAGMEKLPASDAGTTLTRERWLLILFQELGYGRLQTTKAFEIEGKTYPISHLWQATPIHLVSFRQELDRRTPGRSGTARVSPHSLLQELLNRSDDHLWGFVSNGVRLHLLRDNASLTRAACVEFDLQAMMDGEAYSDFFLLFMLCHQSRVEVPDGKTPEHCWLQNWYNTSLKEGTRVLERLRDGVEQAIETLGGGFLAHPANADLREKLRSGQLSTHDYYRQVLRIVYRLLFLFVAEDRDLLLLPASGEPGRTAGDDDPAIAAARDTYTRFYSTQRLRRLAERRRSARHCDLYRGLHLVFHRLHGGCPELALPALGSFLFSANACADLNDANIANADLLAAVWHLTFTVEGNVRRSVDYRNLGPEEFGSVYESLLEMHPEVNVDAGTFALNVAAGSERKTTGSYYTPTSLVNCLLDSALDPILDEACKKPDPEQALLDLKVCDPACGSGHFLIAAAHRLAKRFAAVRAGEDEPSPESVQHALRNVIGRCIYGVDINPMAVELCKINLWMEAIEPGKPLTFLDHHIQCGNSLLGTTPALMAGGIPDDAFKPIEGDDREACKSLKKDNRLEHKTGQRRLFAATASDFLGDLTTAFANLSREDDSTPGALAAKEERYHQLVRSAPYENARLLADAWCAAFVCEKNSLTGFSVTDGTFRRWRESPHDMTPHERETIFGLSDQYQFFHWHLTFPDVFRVPGENEAPENEQTGWSGGFDCVLGNPPWEKITFQDKEWFASRRPEIAQAPNAASRRRMIAELEETAPELYGKLSRDRRRVFSANAFCRNTGLYPLAGRGDINTYALFAELNRNAIRSAGMVGCIVPTGVATDNTMQFFFGDLTAKSDLFSLHSFENEALIFPAVHHSTKFCLLTISRACGKAPRADFVFFARHVADLAEKERHFSLSPDDIRLLNPQTKTCPVFRGARDAELSKMVYRKVPVLGASSDQVDTWGAALARMFHMGDDSDLFHTPEQMEGQACKLIRNVFASDRGRYVPLYEAKMVFHYDHRFGTYEGQTQAQANQGKLPELDVQQHMNAELLALPRYWVAEEELVAFLRGRWGRRWLLGWRNITSAITTRTMVATVIPCTAVGDPYPLILLPEEKIPLVAAFQASLSSFAFDYSVRQKIGGTHLTYTLLEQLPVIRPRAYQAGGGRCWADNLLPWLTGRVLELTCTAWDLQPFGMDCGYDGPAFIWSEERRFLIRCELDAAYFHLYLGMPSEWRESGTTELLEHFPTPRDAVGYIMRTFPLVKQKDEAAHGHYRTKDTILEIYDEMAEAIAVNAAAEGAGHQPTARYQTRLDPPPGPPTDAEGNFIPMAQWDPAHWPAHIHPPREVAVPVPAVAVAETVQADKAFGYINVLVHVWCKPVLREALEAGLVCMLNDDIRQGVLGGRRSSAAPAATGDSEFLLGMDHVLSNLQANRVIRVETRSGRSFISTGDTPISIDRAPAGDVEKAKEAVQAVQKLGESRSRAEYMGVINARYEIVSE